MHQSNVLLGPDCNGLKNGWAIDTFPLLVVPCCTFVFDQKVESVTDFLGNNRSELLLKGVSEFQKTHAKATNNLLDCKQSEIDSDSLSRTKAAPVPRFQLCSTGHGQTWETRHRPDFFYSDPLQFWAFWAFSLNSFAHFASFAGPISALSL